MRNVRARILTPLLLLLPLGMMAQIGQQFWFAAPEMALHSADMTLRLCVAADTTDADITVLMPAQSTTPIQTFHISAGGHYQCTLSPSYTHYMQQLAVPHNQVSPRAVLLQSSAPVTCYVQFTGVNGEIYTLKGENALGTDFSLAMQQRYPNSNLYSKRNIYTAAYASAQIVATQDSTVVEILPTQTLYGDSVPQSRHILLNRGEVYSFRAASKKAAAHPTATRIRSNLPIVVHSMDDSMSPYTQYYGEDAVAEQLVPTSLLSGDYIAMGNGLKWEGVCIIDFTTDSTEFIPMNGREALYIHRDHPVQVFQITGKGNEAGGTQLPSLYHSGSHRVQYLRPADSRWTWVQILTPTSNTSSIGLNGQPLDSALFHTVEGAPEWSCATVNLTHHPLHELITLTSSQDIMHVAIIDASSAMRNTHGLDVITSCSYGYFSSYYKEDPLPLAPPDTVLPAPVDTVPQTDTVLPAPIDTVLPAQKKDTTISRQHQLLLYMEGAYSHLPFGNRDFQWGMGYGAGIGLLYEYRHQHFLLNIGAGFLWQDVEHLSQTDVTTPFIDSQHDNSTLNMRISRSDRARLGYVEIPLLVGGIWQWWYLLGGIKVGIPVFGNTRSEARITNYAIYDQYFVPFSNMANHGLQIDVPTTRQEGRLTYAVDTRLSLETGVNLGRYRLGIYADYGALWPRLNKGDMPFMQIVDPVNMSTWELHHPLHSEVSNSHHTHTIFAGIKFTILLLP